MKENLLLLKDSLEPLNKIYNHLNSSQKNVFIDELDDIVSICNKTCHSAIQMKHVAVKSNTYVESSKNINDENPKFKIVYIVISKYKNIFAKVYTLYCSEEVFAIIKVKNTVPWIYLISDFKFKKFLVHFTKTNCKKQIKENLELKKQ